MGHRAEEIQEIKEKLLKEREELINKLKKDKREELRSLNDDDIGDNFDKASQEISMEAMLTFSDMDKKKLADIEVALKKIENGTYGICEECGDEIPIIRLQYLPFAKYCIECQEDMEQRDKKHNKKTTVIEDGLYKKDIGDEDDIIKLEDE